MIAALFTLGLLAGGTVLLMKEPKERRD